MSKARTLSKLLGGTVPSALDTLNEIATALGNDASLASTITTALATKANSSSLATVATSGSASDLSAGTLPIARVADGAVTAAKLHTTAVTDKLGYTPLNKAGDTMSGPLNMVGSNVQKRLIGGEQSTAVGGSAIKRVEEMINFYHPRNANRYFKVRVKERYAADAMGGALTLTLGKFSEHASYAHWRVYKIMTGSGSGGDPTGWNMAWWTEKEAVAGWNYYATSFTFEVFYPSNSSASRDYFYIRINSADNQGSVQSAHSFLHLDGFVGLSDLPLLVDLGTTQPSDWGNYSSLASSGTW